MTKPAGRHVAAVDRDVPSAPQRQRHRRLRPVSRRCGVVVLLCGLLVIGTGACGMAIASNTGHPASPPAGKPKLVPVPRGDRAPVPQPSDSGQVARPASLIIPSIGVKTSLIRLGGTAARAPPTAAATRGR